MLCSEIASTESGSCFSDCGLNFLKRVVTAHAGGLADLLGPDLPIGYAGLSLGPQDPRGPPKNCCTHRLNCRYDQFHKYSSTP